MEMKNYFENPHSFSVNTLATPLALAPFATKEDALSQEGDYAKQVTPLMNNWAHYTFDAIDQIPEELFSANLPLESYETVHLPYGAENKEDPFPFFIDPPYLPSPMKVQLFAKNLNLTNKEEGHQRILAITGCCNGCYVYLNGNLVGYHGQPGVGVSFDCTPYFQQGANRLVLVVPALTVANYLVPYRHFGILGEVTLLSRKTGGVQALSLTYDLPSHYKQAVVTAQIDALCPEEVTLCLYHPNGELLEQKNCNSDGVMEFTIKDPQLWSHETPSLYTLLACFRGEVTRHTFGLRNCVFTKERLTVNGREVTLNGVTYSPIGKSKDQLATDLCQMKKHHVNTLWVEEFPQSELLSLCDRLGLYAIVGTGIHTPYLTNCSHNFVANDLLLRDMIMHRCEALVQQSMNPCVVARKVGAYCGVGSNMKFALDTLRHLDPKTPAFTQDVTNLLESDLFIATNDANPPLVDKPCVVLGNPAQKPQESIGWIVGSFEQVVNGEIEVPPSFSPIEVTLVNGTTGELEITNRNAFTYFSKFRCDYEIVRYGKVAKKGVGGIFSLPPVTTEQLQLSYRLPADGECSLRLLFTYLGDTPYAKSGELAGQFQFALPVGTNRNETPVQGDLPELVEQENQLHIYAAGCHYTISTTLGQLVGIEYQEQELLLPKKPGEFLTGCRGVSYSLEENCIVVTAQLKIGKKGSPPAATLTKRWTFYPDGCVTVEPTILPDNIGFQGEFVLNNSFKGVECYATRHTPFGNDHGLFKVNLQKEELATTKGKLFRFTAKNGVGLALFHGTVPFALQAKACQKNGISVSFTPPVSFTLKPVSEDENLWDYYNNTYRPLRDEN